MFTIYLHTKFKIALCNQQLVTATKQMPAAAAATAAADDNDNNNDVDNNNNNNNTLHAIMNKANEQLILLFCPSEALTSNLDSETSNLIQIKCFPLSMLHYRMITEQ